MAKTVASKLFLTFLFSLAGFGCAPKRVGSDEPVSGVGLQKFFRETYAAHREHFLFHDEITGHAVKSLSELDDATISMLTRDPFYLDLVALMSAEDNPLVPSLPDGAQLYPRVTALLILGTSYRRLPAEQRPAPGGDLIEPILRLANYEVKSPEDLRYRLVIPRYWPAVAARGAYEIYRARVLAILARGSQPSGGGLGLAGDAPDPAAPGWRDYIGGWLQWGKDQAVERAIDVGLRAASMASQSADVVIRALELKDGLAVIAEIEKIEGVAEDWLDRKPTDIKIGDQPLSVVEPKKYHRLLKYFPNDTPVKEALQALVNKDLGNIDAERVLLASLRREPDDLLRLFSGPGAEAFVRLLGAVGDLAGKGEALATILGSRLEWLAATGKFQQELVGDLNALQEVFVESPDKLEKALAALGKLGDENFVANLQAGLSQRNVDGATQMKKALASLQTMDPEVFDVVVVVLQRVMAMEPESLVITRRIILGESSPSKFQNIPAEDIRKFIQAVKDGNEQVKSVKDAISELDGAVGFQRLARERVLSEELGRLLGRDHGELSDPQLNQWKANFSAFVNMGEEARLIADGRPILQTFVDRAPSMARFAIGIGAQVPPDLLKLIVEESRSPEDEQRLRTALGNYIDDMQSDGLHELTRNMEEVDAARPYLEFGVINSRVAKALKGSGERSDGVRNLAFDQAGIPEDQRAALAERLQGTPDQKSTAIAELRDHLRRSDRVSHSLLRDAGLQRIPPRGTGVPSPSGSARRQSLVAYSLIAAFGAGVTVVAHETNRTPRNLNLAADDWRSRLEDILKGKATAY